jgi:hypothetical protein
MSDSQSDPPSPRIAPDSRQLIKSASRSTAKHRNREKAPALASKNWAEAWRIGNWRSTIATASVEKLSGSNLESEFVGGIGCGWGIVQPIPVGARAPIRNAHELSDLNVRCWNWVCGSVRYGRVKRPRTRGDDGAEPCRRLHGLHPPCAHEFAHGHPHQHGW